MGTQDAAEEEQDESNRRVDDDIKEMIDRRLFLPKEGTYTRTSFRISHLIQPINLRDAGLSLIHI